MSWLTLGMAALLMVLAWILDAPVFDEETSRATHSPEPSIETKRLVWAGQALCWISLALWAIGL